MNRSKAIILSHQQFGDEECAEQKKNRNAEVAEKADVVEPVVLRLMRESAKRPMRGDSSGRYLSCPLLFRRQTVPFART